MSSSVEDALETSDESPVDDDVYDAVAGLSGGDDDRVTGADLTLLRGRLIDGDNEIDGVTVTGSDLTLLRGYLLDRSWTRGRRMVGRIRPSNSNVT